MLEVVSLSNGGLSEVEGWGGTRNIRRPNWSYHSSLLSGYNLMPYTDLDVALVSQE